MQLTHLLRLCRHKQDPLRCVFESLVPNPELRRLLSLLLSLLGVSGVLYFLFLRPLVTPRQRQRRAAAAADPNATTTTAASARDGSSRSLSATSSGLAGAGGARRRRVTLSLSEGVVFAAKSTEPLLSAVPVLLWLAANTDLYLMCRVDSDDEEAAVRTALAATGVYDLGLHRAKLLFCSTSMGKASMVRQLEPAVHLDADVGVCTSLARFLPELVLIASEQDRPSSLPDNVSVLPSLLAYAKHAKLPVV